MSRSLDTSSRTMMRCRRTQWRHGLAFRWIALLALLLPTVTFAQGESEALEGVASLTEDILEIVLPTFDEELLRQADERRVRQGRVPHFAVGHEIRLGLWNDDQWQLVGDQARWRARIISHGAFSLSLGLRKFRLPEGGLLTVRAADGETQLVFDSRDNETHGQLWTPPLPGDSLLVELVVPFEALDDVELEISRVHHGYAGFGEPAPRAGECHRDIVCYEGEAWSEQARSVGLVSIAGVRFCTGFLVNNTALDGRPYFLTARHCGIDERSAPSVVVMWNYRRPLCQGGDARSEVSGGFQTGAMLRTEIVASDTLLLELDDLPPSDAYFAGWDRGEEPPRSSTVIHHPNTDAQRISFDFDSAVATHHLRDESRDGASHLRVGDWEIGSTEGGSSGAPLFNQDRRAVGQLHGGWAACGNTQADWFGRLSNAWHGRPSDGGLADWLDPIDSEALTLDGVEASLVISDDLSSDTARR